MTRINCVSTKEMSLEHLLAEHDELPRVYDLAHRSFLGGEDTSDHGERYTFGKGHVRFFYSKLAFVRTRQHLVYQELLHRGEQVSYPDFPDRELPAHWFTNWEPTSEDIQLNRNRLAERRRYIGGIYVRPDEAVESASE